MTVLVLKVDVDTFRGMKEGVPRIVRTLGKCSVPASFFISFGPYRSGLAVLQLMRPKFLIKMIRTNAPAMYGLNTALYGTILPAPIIGKRFPRTIKNLVDLGHEVACHAWDHRLWQDWLFLMGRQSIDRWFEKMVEACISITGIRPMGFGAPGWRINKKALRSAGASGFAYLSSSRAEKPYIFKENGMLEIPSNLPCIEEAGVAGVLAELEKNAASSIIQVLPVHAEVEGGVYSKAFENILNRALSLGYKVNRMSDVASDLDKSGLESRPIKQGIVAGRAFKCAV